MSSERERVVKALNNVAHKIRTAGLLVEYDAKACKEAIALLRAEPVGEPVAWMIRARKRGSDRAWNPWRLSPTPVVTGPNDFYEWEERALIFATPPAATADAGEETE